MRYKFLMMNDEYAKDIAYGWKYDGKYSFYDMTADEEDLQEFLQEENWKDQYFAVLNKKEELIGFYSFSFIDDTMWLGFGLKPELTGRGLGEDFILSGIEFGIEKFSYQKDHIMLAVASFNERAINAYTKMGFKPVEKYMQKTNGGEYEFIKMRLDNKKEE